MDKQPQLPAPGGFFDRIGLRIKLILRLMGDRRVPFLLKLLPVVTLVYLVMPDLAPGPIDDAAIIWLGAQLFVELCPDEVVAEHERALASVVEGEWHEVDTAEDDRDELPEA